MFKFYVTTPWCSIAESRAQVKLKKEFIEKYKKMSQKISRRRADTLRHYFSYALKQSALNELDDRIAENFFTESQLRAEKRVKFKPGGTPSRDRVIVNEKLTLGLKQIEEMREYSHAFCQKNIEKIELDLKERTQKLLLPSIQNIK